MVAVAFVAMLTAPSLGAVFGASGFDAEIENRSPAPFPVLRQTSLTQFPAAFERWFADHFAFRNKMVRRASLLKVAMGVSSSSRVVIGRKGLLFFAGERSMELYQGGLRLSPSELGGWRSALEQRRAALERRGIRYAILFGPDKQTIYPDAVPAAFPRLPGPSELDRVLEALANETSVTAFDVRPSIRRARSVGPVYWSTDTHWNGRGIFAAYRTVMTGVRDWFPVARLLGYDDVYLVSDRGRGGDLSRMLGLPDDLPERTRVSCGVRSARAHPANLGFTPDPKTLRHLWPQAFQIDDAGLPRALLLGDSFMAGLLPFLAEGFSRTVYIGNHNLDKALVEREKPDVVIEEWVERYIPAGPPDNAEWIVHPADVLPSHMDEPQPDGEPLPPTTSWPGNEVMRLEGGVLQAIGNDPYIATNVNPFDAQPSLSISLPLTATASAPAQQGLRFAQLFWSIDGAGYEEAASLRFPILVDGIPHIYRVFPSFSRGFRGRITGLRLDFPDALRGVLYGLGELQVSAPAKVRAELDK